MMKVIPEGLKTNFLEHAVTAFSDVRKPVFGSLDSLFCEFRVHQEFSEADSRKAGKEVKKEVEVLLIHTDRFSVVPKRVGSPDSKMPSELTPEMQFKTAALYERFKTQKNSTDTLIYEWEALSSMEKSQLISLGIMTVEQLHKMPKHELYRLGSGGLALWERAERHVKTKKENDPSESRRELELVMEENRAIRMKQEDAEKRYLALQEQIARMEREQANKAPAKKNGSRPIKSLEQEQLQKAA